MSTGSLAKQEMVQAREIQERMRRIQRNIGGYRLRKPIYVKDKQVGYIEKVEGGWKGVNEHTSTQAEPFTSDLRAACWVREETIKRPGVVNRYEVK